jgi:hypothetical protein
LECEEEPEGIVAMYVVCIFGDTRAGHVYNLASRAIDHGHNRGRETKRSWTYVDDGILCDTEDAIMKSQSEYLDWIRLLFGEGGIKSKKISPISQDLIAIGWHWNLREDVWNVGPKRRGLLKMYIAVFFMIRPDDTKKEARRSIPRRGIQHVSSLLMWWSAVLPMGRSFVLPIMRCAGPEEGAYGARKCFLSHQAKMDVEWWRIIITLALKYPHVMRVPIGLIAASKTADFLLQTDASTSKGGGGWLAAYDNQQDISRTAVIRWTAEEQCWFEDTRADINVLEFFAAAVLVIAWGDLFANKKILIRVDNTSAKKWVVSNRFSKGAAWADSFMSLFSLYCAINNIFIISEHVAGVDNDLADTLSRDVDLKESWGQEATKVGLNSRIKSKGILCRRYFMDCARTQSPMPLPSLLATLESLLEMDGTASA